MNASVALKSSAGSGTVIASIVTWNHKDSIAACIESLLAQSYPCLEIIVHDNDSKDGTKDTLKQFSSKTRLVFNDKNTGFCGGHNSAIRMSQSEFVLLVNPDVVLNSDYVGKAVHQMQQTDRIGTVCGVLLQSDPSFADCKIDGAGLRVSKARRFELRFYGCDYHCTKLTPTEVFGADGALPLYRRAMINEISIGDQFFDEMLFAHKEDHDIAWRAQLCGWKTFFDPSCIAVHPRVFKPGNLGVRKGLGDEVRARTIRNDLIVLLKNEDLSNLVLDAPWIFFRRLAILLYVVAREHTSLEAYGFVMRNFRAVLRQRTAVQRKRKVSPAAIRRAFTMPEH